MAVEEIGLKGVLDLDTSMYDKASKRLVTSTDRLFDKLERREKRHVEKRLKFTKLLENAQRLNDVKEVNRFRRKLHQLERIEQAYNRRTLGRRLKASLTSSVGVGGGPFSSLLGGAGGLARAGATGLVAGGVGLAGGSFAIGAKVASNWIKGAEALKLYETQLNLLLSKRGEQKEFNKLATFARTFARDTSFSASEVRGTQISLLSAGAKTSDIQTLTKRLGELASFNSTTLAEVTRPLARLFSGDFGEAFERLRDFRISKQDLEGSGGLKGKFSKGGAFTGKSEEAVNAVLKVITSKFGGALETASLTLSGKVNVLTGSFAILGEKFAKFPAQGLKTFVDSLTNIVNSPELEKSVGIFGEQLGGIFTQLTEFVKLDGKKSFETVGNLFISVSKSLTNLITSGAFQRMLDATGDTVDFTSRLITGASAVFKDKSVGDVVGDIALDSLKGAVLAPLGFQGATSTTTTDRFTQGFADAGQDKIQAGTRRELLVRRFKGRLRRRTSPISDEEVEQASVDIFKTGEFSSVGSNSGQILAVLKEALLEHKINNSRAKENNKIGERVLKDIKVTKTENKK